MFEEEDWEDFDDEDDEDDQDDCIEFLNPKERKKDIKTSDF